VILIVYFPLHLFPLEAECCYAAAQWYPPQTLRTSLFSSLDHVRCWRVCSRFVFDRSKTA